VTIFPDAATGDAWFEGPRQWLRLMAVRHFGASDYRCEDSTFGTMKAGSSAKDAATRRAARARMCTLYGPSAEMG